MKVTLDIGIEVDNIHDKTEAHRVADMIIKACNDCLRTDYPLHSVRYCTGELTEPVVHLQANVTGEAALPAQGDA